MVWEYECIAHSVLGKPVFFGGKSLSPTTTPPPVYSCSRASDRIDKNFVVPVLPSCRVKTHFLGAVLGADIVLKQHMRNQYKRTSDNRRNCFIVVMRSLQLKATKTVCSPFDHKGTILAVCFLLKKKRQKTSPAFSLVFLQVLAHDLKWHWWFLSCPNHTEPSSNASTVPAISIIFMGK